jgi:hypothetical protein
MNEAFEKSIGRVQELFAKLDREEIRPLLGTNYPQSPAIYVFFEDKKQFMSAERTSCGSGFSDTVGKITTAPHLFSKKRVG